MSRLRRIAVVTGSRADYGILCPVMRAIGADCRLQLLTIVAGMHLVPDFGRTGTALQRDGFAIDFTVDMLLASDSCGGMARSIGVGVIGFAQAFEHLSPDAVLVLGDRVEAFGAATAAHIMRLPVFHLHGGERTGGAVDDALRHSISRLCSYHLVSCALHAERLVKMGEPPERIAVVGAPALDLLKEFRPLSLAKLGEQLGTSLRRPFILMTYHPVTLAADYGLRGLEEVLAALESVGSQVICTYPNTDAGGRAVIERLRGFESEREGFHLYQSLGQRVYMSLMGSAHVMVGNSSSGIVEAPSLGLPVVNVGSRQEGRCRGGNVLDVPEERDAIRSALVRAIGDQTFRRHVASLENPYGDGAAAQRVVELLAKRRLGFSAIQKRMTY